MQRIPEHLLSSTSPRVLIVVADMEHSNATLGPTLHMLEAIVAQGMYIYIHYYKKKLYTRKKLLYHDLLPMTVHATVYKKKLIM